MDSQVLAMVQQLYGDTTPASQAKFVQGIPPDAEDDDGTAAPDVGDAGTPPVPVAADTATAPDAGVTTSDDADDADDADESGVPAPTTTPSAPPTAPVDVTPLPPVASMQPGANASANAPATTPAAPMLAPGAGVTLAPGGTADLELDAKNAAQTAATAQADEQAAIAAKAHLGQGGGDPNTNAADLKLINQAAESARLAAAATKKYQEDIAAAEAPQAQHIADVGNDAIDDAREAEQRATQSAFTMADQMAKGAKDLANTRIDPDQYWNSRSLGQKVLIGLSFALGGLGMSANGGVNPGMQIYQQHVQNSIDTQKDNYNIQHDANNTYGILVNKYLDIGANADEAARGTELAMQNQALLNGHAAALKYGGEKAGAQFLTDTAAWQNKLATERQLLATNIKDRQLKSAQASQAYAEAGQASATAAATRQNTEYTSQSHQLLQNPNIAAAALGSTPGAVRLRTMIQANGMDAINIDGVPTLGTKEYVAKAAEFIPKYQKANDIIDQLIGLRTNKGQSFGPTKLSNDYKSLQTQLEAALTALQGESNTGQGEGLTSRNAELYNNIVNANSWTDALPRIQQLKANLEAERQQRLRSLHLVQ